MSIDSHVNVFHHQSKSVSIINFDDVGIPIYAKFLFYVSQVEVDIHSLELIIKGLIWDFGSVQLLLDGRAILGQLLINKCSGSTHLELGDVSAMPKNKQEHQHQNHYR